MTEHRATSPRDVGAATLGTLETRVFDKGWGSVHHDALALASSKTSHDFASAISATRAATLASVSKSDGMDCLLEHPFWIAALSHSQSDPWPSAVLRAVAPSVMSISSGVDASRAKNHKDIVETLNTHAADACGDKLDRANGIPAQPVLAALQPFEAVWVKEAMWLPPGVNPDFVGDDECGFENLRQFGKNGMFFTVDVPKPETSRHRTIHQAAPGKLRRMRPAVPVRKSSNAVDKAIGNKFSNRRLANGAGASPVLVQLGSSAKSKTKSAFYSSARNNSVGNQDLVDAEKKMALVKEKAGQIGNGQRVARMTCSNPKTSALPDADETREANENVRLENPKYKRIKVAEARAEKQRLEEEARRCRQQEREATGDGSGKLAGKRARALEQRRRKEAKIREKYPGVDAIMELDSESQLPPVSCEEAGNDKDVRGENFENVADDNVEYADHEGSRFKRIRLGSDRSDGRCDDAPGDQGIEIDETWNHGSRVSPSDAPAAAFETLAWYRNAGQAHEMSGSSQIPSLQGSNPHDSVETRLYSDALDDAKMKKTLEQLGSDPSGEVWHSHHLFREIQAFWNGDEQIFESSRKPFKDYKLSANYDGDKVVFFVNMLRLYSSRILGPNDPRFEVIRRVS